MTRSRSPWLLALAFLAAAVYPAVDRWIESGRLRRRMDHLRSASTGRDSAAARACDFAPDPALLVRVAALGPLLAGWQTIGGCGAGSGTGGGAGLKWIGRGVSGGLFNVQSQATYTRIHSSTGLEQHMFVNTLITRELSEKWILGANIPYVYKYFTDYFFLNPLDPLAPGIDVSNGGLGDMSLQLTRRLGRINATTLTAMVGLPTGAHNGRYRGKLLLQQQQLGFGRPTANLILDHAMDEIWGVIVVGGVASWRGGQNEFDNYRAPSATTYAYSGYFLGPFVPAIGLAATGFRGHDRDQTLEQMTPLFSLTGNVSLEWSTDWIAVLAGASMPYQYDGFLTGTNAVPRSPWALGPWTVALGLALSPF